MPYFIYRQLFRILKIKYYTDWKLGFTGRNGRGKTTFLNLLLGRYEYSGNISATVGFEYFPYEIADKTKETMGVMHDICPDCMDWEIIREIALLDVCEDVLYRPFSTLSNGEQTKMLLAALFLTSNKFLLIDEPTNHLDEETRKIVGRYLKKKQGFILISHDRLLLDSCVDHILSINKTNIEIQRATFRLGGKTNGYRTTSSLPKMKSLKRISADFLSPQNVMQIGRARLKAVNMTPKIPELNRIEAMSDTSQPK